MILRLYNGKIYVKDMVCPELINKVKIKYEFEIGTNHLQPSLCINDKEYTGNNIEISLDPYAPLIHMIVYLRDGHKSIIKKYENTFNLYPTFVLGDYEQVNVYKELVKAQERIIQLEEEGDII